MGENVGKFHGDFLIRTGIFTNYVTANFPQSVPLKEFLKSVNIWRRCKQKFGGMFFFIHGVVNPSLITECCVFSAASLSGCHSSTNGIHFWTAGQRTDPTTESTFIWRVKSADMSSETVSPMSYTNWDPGQPDYGGQACMQIWSGPSYTWDDEFCSSAFCFVCEFDRSAGP